MAEEHFGGGVLKKSSDGDTDHKSWKVSIIFRQVPEPNFVISYRVTKKYCDFVIRNDYKVAKPGT